MTHTPMMKLPWDSWLPAIELNGELGMVSLSLGGEFPGTSLHLGGKRIVFTGGRAFFDSSSLKEIIYL